LTNATVGFDGAKVTSRAVLFDANLDLYSLEQLRRWRRDLVAFAVIDIERDEDITKILLV
jgi:hypothetical protein